MFPLVRVGHVKMHETSRVAELFGDTLTGIVENVTDHHARALGHQRFGMGRTHPPRPAGDQHHLLVNTAP